MGSVIASLSGIRAEVGDTLTPDLVLSWAQAFGTFIGKGPVIIGGDTRVSYELCKYAAFSGFLATGTEIIYIGNVPTPTVQQAIQKHHAAGGFILTASHNPIQWNGVKLMNDTGSFLNQEEFDQVNAIRTNQTYDLKPYTDLGKITQDDTALTWHIDKILRLIDPHAIRKSSLKVLVDANHGVGAIATPQLLDRLGVEYDVLFPEPTGVFNHDPEPSKINLVKLMETMQKGGYDIGFAQDADADRLVIVDEKGNFIGEDYSLAFCIDYILKNDLSGSKDVVVNLSTSRLIEYLAKQHQAIVHYTKIGEPNVTAELKSLSALVGGEGNGGVIYPKIGWGRDSLVGIIIALKYLAETKQSVSSIVDRYPKYSMVRDKIKVDSQSDALAILDKVKSHYQDSEQNLVDGVKVNFDDSWLHVRTSNTEPIVRIFAEARHYDDAFKLVQSVSNL